MWRHRPITDVDRTEQGMGRSPSSTSSKFELTLQVPRDVKVNDSMEANVASPTTPVKGSHTATENLHIRPSLRSTTSRNSFQCGPDSPSSARSPFSSTDSFMGVVYEEGWQGNEVGDFLVADREDPENVEKYESEVLLQARARTAEVISIEEFLNSGRNNPMFVSRFFAKEN